MQLVFPATIGRRICYTWLARRSRNVASCSRSSSWLEVRVQSRRAHASFCLFETEVATLLSCSAQHTSNDIRASQATAIVSDPEVYEMLGGSPLTYRRSLELGT